MIRSIIDIGTNTTHLIIAEVIDNKIRKVHYKKRFYTFLGEDGLDNIGAKSLSRLWKGLDHFKNTLSDYRSSTVHVIATEGLRASINREEILEKIKKDYNWRISLISGITESELIYKGVIQSLEVMEGSHLIMDIGGGSVEFIWVLNGLKRFQNSYPIGISRLYDRFHKNEPCDSNDLESMKLFLMQSLKDLWLQIGEYREKTILIGCAGTFEIFMNKDQLSRDDLTSVKVSSSRLTSLLEEVKSKDLRSRKLVKDLPQERAQYIVVALELVEHVLNMLACKDFIVSKYALKEGALVSDIYF